MSEAPGRLTIVGLGGSLRTASHSRAALEVALAGAEEAGAETKLLDLRELALPMFDPEHESPAGPAAELVETCYAADGMLWSSPLYQGTVSGAFKNSLDWLHILGSREPPYLHDKVVGLISAAGGMQGLQAINTMEFSARARSVPGLFRTSSRSHLLPGPSTATVVSTTTESRRSSEPWAVRSCA
ncbi:MAG TPA: NAD(P)H-dependent oxidoreductase [Gaiellaceae bacterium]|nr:NAD(P)H-dependent oxidoreductase [Gaiellaceae bacterium]